MRDAHSDCLADFRGEYSASPFLGVAVVSVDEWWCGKPLLTRRAQRRKERKEHKEKRIETSLVSKMLGLSSDRQNTNRFQSGRYGERHEVKKLFFAPFASLLSSRQKRLVFLAIHKISV